MRRIRDIKPITVNIKIKKKGIKDLLKKFGAEYTGFLVYLLSKLFNSIIRELIYLARIFSNLDFKTKSLKMSLVTKLII